MAMQFYGHSLETCQMRNTPIGEGYTFFTLTTSQGFVVNFTPDDQMAVKSQQQEYATHHNIAEIENRIHNNQLLQQEQQAQERTYQ
eukprot:4587564-Ditylum_brightwellii.AAC.1